MEFSLKNYFTLYYKELFDSFALKFVTTVYLMSYSEWQYPNDPFTRYKGNTLSTHYTYTRAPTRPITLYENCNLQEHIVVAILLEHMFIKQSMLQLLLSI